MHSAFRLSWIAFLLIHFNTSAQLLVTPYDPVTAATMLMGSDVSVFNVTYSGDPVQLGWASNISSFPTENGLILSSSNAQNFIPGTFNGEPTTPLNNEPDLLTIANSVPPLIGQNFTVSGVYDVAILEFDFVATGANMDLNFVYGSDEYLTYVNSQYNDVFAILMSGPGIAGPYAAPAGFPNGAANLALIPESNPPLPITISSLNNVLNNNYYIDNPGNIINPNVSLTGYTDLITVNQALTPGATYHLKLAIADGSDAGLKSQIILYSSYGSNANNALCTFIDADNLTICEGSNVLLSVDDNFNFEVNSDILIPIENNTNCIQSEVYVYQQGAGHINSVSEIEQIHFSLEHSDLSDVSISLTCPNGSNMTIFTGNENYFSEVNAGQPIEENNAFLGVPYGYSFSPLIEGSTWEEFIISTDLPAIPSGYYASEESFNQLIGCPINGFWTLNICPTNPIPYSGDCLGATSICNGVYSDLPPVYSNGTENEFTGSCIWPYGNNPFITSWYLLEINNSGDLAFVITPEDTLADYDWAIFNITDGGCESLMYEDSLTIEIIEASNEVSCNSYGNIGYNGATGLSNLNGGTGNSNGPGPLNGPPFNPNIDALSGETYALVLVNFNNNSNQFSIDFSESTAQFCGANPPNSIIGNGHLTEFGISFHQNNPNSNYSWSTGEMTSSIVVNPESTTTFYLFSEANGESCVDSVIVFVEPSVQITSEAPLVILNGNPVLLEANGGNSYEWTSGSTSNQLEVYTPGYFEVVGFTDHCVSADTIYLSDINLPCAEIAEDSIVICPGASILLNALSGGADEVNGAFYIPDNQGCLDIELEINQYETSTIVSPEDISNIYFTMEHSFVGDITIAIVCPDGSVMSIFPEAGGSGTYLGEPFDNDDGVPGVGYDYSFSPNSTGGTWMEYLSAGASGTIPAGDYEPEGSFDDLIGCPLNGTWTLEVCDIVGADDGYVFEFGIQFIASTPIDSLTWSTGETSPTIIVNPLETTTYYLYSFSNGMACTDSAIVVVENPLQISSSGPTSICDGNPIQLIASGADNYLWSTGSTANQITVLTAGTYEVTGFSENCISTDSILITDNSESIEIMADTTSFCSGDTVNLFSSIVLTDYYWNNGATGSSIDITTGGNYFVAGTDAFGCDYSSDIITITEYPFDNSITATDDAICDGESVTLGVNPENNIVWNNGETTPNLIVTEPGTYYALVTNGPCTGYTASIEINAGVTPTVDAFAVEDTLCNDGSSTLLFGTPAGGTWEGPGMDGNNFQSSLAGAGEFVISYIYTNPAGCSATANETISVQDCSLVYESATNSAFSVYPNPTNNYFLIENHTHQIFTFEIFDMSGKRIQSGTSQENEWISLNLVQSGFYTVRISGEQSVHTYPIIKL